MEGVSRADNLINPAALNTLIQDKPRLETFTTTQGPLPYSKFADIHLELFTRRLGYRNSKYDAEAIFTFTGTFMQSQNLKAALQFEDASQTVIRYLKPDPAESHIFRELSVWALFAGRDLSNNPILSIREVLFANVEVVQAALSVIFNMRTNKRPVAGFDEPELIFQNSFILNLLTDDDWEVVDAL